jgi:hypothetical protein
MHQFLYGLCFICAINSFAYSADEGRAGAGGPASLRELFPDLPRSFPLPSNVFSGEPPYNVDDFPCNIDFTNIFKDDDPIPLPRSYEPLVDILRRVQDPTLTFGEAKLLIESQADLILTLYKPKYGKPDPRLYYALGCLLGGKSIDEFRGAKSLIDRLVDEGAAKQPDDLLDFPLTWQFVVCHLKTLEQEKNRLKAMPKSDVEKAELKKHVREQKRELSPLYASAVSIGGLYDSIGAVFRTVIGIQRNAPRDFFGETNINLIFQALSLSEENPCSPLLAPAAHKLLFMIYFNFLLFDLYQLYHAHMEGLDYNDRGEQLFFTFESDYPKPFREVCSGVWKRGSFFKNVGWNIFHHVNAMLPHIVYVDY